jgi:hypothetical protein
LSGCANTRRTIGSNSPIVSVSLSPCASKAGLSYSAMNSSVRAVLVALEYVAHVASRPMWWKKL